MNKHLASAQKFVQRNKTALVVAAITIPVIVLQHQGIKSLNNFLAEKGLDTEYYYVEEI